MDMTLADIQARLKALAERIEALEARLAHGAGADQAQRPVEQKPCTIHPTTLRKMKEHAPPLSESELTLWRARFKPGRRYKVMYIAEKGFPGDIRAKAKALRVGFWLKKEGYLIYDSKTREYLRPVRTT